MEFRVLGPLEVRRGVEVLELRGSKRRAVLAVLALHVNEVVRTDRLIDEVWGDHPPANAAAAVQNRISRLRKELGVNVLVTRPWGYVLRTDPGSVDLVRFESMVAEAKPLAAEERARLLRRALALWRGPPLADLAREQGLAVELARLEELRVATIEQRIDAELELGRHEELIPELEGLVSEHPLRERLRGQLILALYRAGRQAEALETYRETRRVLTEELGIEPGPLLRELERAVLRQDPALAASQFQAEELAPREDEHRWRWPRSPLAVTLALFGLCGVGATAAVLVATDERKSQAEVALGTQQVAAQTQATTTTADPVTTHVARTNVTKTAPRVATTQASGSTRARASAPPGEPSSRGPTRLSRSVYAPQRKVYWLTDDFEQPGTNERLWYVDENGGNVVDVGEQNGRLEMWVDPQAVPEHGRFDARYGTLCRLRGDFDARVEYKLLTWPPGNGVSLTLGAYLGSWPPPLDFMWVARASDNATAGLETYSTQVRSDAGAISTADMSGALRITRVYGLLSTYYKKDELLYSGEIQHRWVKLASATAPHPANLILMLSSSSDQFGGSRSAAAFDNFQATADGVLCDGVPLPPLKPRP